jgi:DNA ligase (NAD+)
LKRAGDVIPYVIGPIIEARTGKEASYIAPDRCPVCGEPIERVEGEVAAYCVNTSCPAQLVRNLEHFASRGALDIEGLGIKVSGQLVEHRMIADVADLYSLQRESLLELEGYAEKKVDNLLAAIEASKEQSLVRLINALGIRGVGSTVAVDLASNFLDLDALMQADQEQLESIEGIGPNTAQALRDWFDQPRNRNVLEKLRQTGFWPQGDAGAQAGPESDRLANLTFVLSGTLPGMTRDEARSLIEAHGGRVTGSVSAKTDYLLAGESPGSKKDKAQSLGVAIIDESQLRALIAGK